MISSRGGRKCERESDRKDSGKGRDQSGAGRRQNLRKPGAGKGCSGVHMEVGPAGWAARGASCD